MNQKFAKDFTWGVATSAYQIEGAANEGGRGPSIWDTFSHTPGKTVNGETGDVACDHYHRYQEDVDLIAGLGVDAYRFSIAWPRVQPDGKGAWNEAGFDFYSRLIDALLVKGLQPYVTLYHWDLPQALEDVGGWRNRDTCYRFADYAAEFMRRYGDSVKTISTHNEPWCTATLGHATGQFAPGYQDEAMAYQVSHHLLLSHGLALQSMRAVNRETPVGIVLNHTPTYPANPDSEADRQLARLDDGTNIRWYMDPIFRGAYPQDVLAYLGDKAPKVTVGDMDIIRQPLDFLGVNYYTRGYFSQANPQTPAPAAMGLTDMGWEVYPQGLAQHLVRITRDYLPPPIYITENGAAFPDRMENGEVQDPARIHYLETHLQALRQAMEMGADIRGYFYWSLADNYEWNWGYSKRFGLTYVDYATQQRTLKASGHWYRDFIARQRA
ncbi:beta-glucosidase [Hahella sp. KA22]|uniref:GH1 family beta-glucosidase n=1 Tax=Hahella sp. KA22 TaxID=1628392 RepID=UPI000FDCF6FC|nr:GH1 family beta-glucosidase [Hahella sp. KA22]AZZ95214.1 beta-glucosidase [Hahella sp. KA22]QAY52859.1 beta-glucosidase [Hahella sp. KA22]